MNETNWKTHLQDWIQAACLLEATARKPGNVHPEASFADLEYQDFVRSAELAAISLAESRELGVGRAVFEAVSRTMEVVGRNTNLGIALLIAPLAAVPPKVPLAAGVRSVLRGLTREDAVWAYRAIRLARPAGLGRVETADISEEPQITLLDAMHLARERDDVANQYATEFRLVLQHGCRMLAAGGDFEDQWERQIIRCHLLLMASRPDSLIARKCGLEIAREAAARAHQVLESDEPEMLAEFDRWLRADGHRRNPGTTADLVAASLFAALRERLIRAPESVRHRQPA